MTIEFTINPTDFFYSVMDKTILDKKGIESVGNTTLGDKFAISKDESDAFFVELDHAINALCLRVPQLCWEPNDGINMSADSTRQIEPHNVAMLVERALSYLMLVWWYESRHAGLAARAEENGKMAILALKRALEPNMTTRQYRYF